LAMDEASAYPSEVNEIYRSRRDTLVRGLGKIGWEVEPPRATMFLWASIPDVYRRLGSVDFCSMLLREAGVALSPGLGFGPGGEGHVRFALVENEHRIRQAVAGLRRALPGLRETATPAAAQAQ
ncbi:MAG: aminotransferase class I/II-fold pyridoxal phosphate-dependent enzyme, partial [Gaiellales bacterium]